MMLFAPLLLSGCVTNGLGSLGEPSIDLRLGADGRGRVHADVLRLRWKDGPACTAVAPLSATLDGRSLWIDQQESCAKADILTFWLEPAWTPAQSAWQELQISDGWTTWTLAFVGGRPRLRPTDIRFVGLRELSVGLPPAAEGGPGLTLFPPPRLADRLAAQVLDPTADGVGVRYTLPADLPAGNYRGVLSAVVPVETGPCPVAHCAVWTRARHSVTIPVGAAPMPRTDVY